MIFRWGTGVISLSRRVVGDRVGYIVKMKPGKWRVVFDGRYERGKKIYLNGKMVDGNVVELP